VNVVAGVVADGLLGSVVAAFATVVGALPILIGSRPSPRVLAWMLALSGGVMLGATFFSLLQPALEVLGERTGSAVVAAALAGVGVVCGAGALWFVHDMLPHAHSPDEATAEGVRRLRLHLFVLAIALHNFPEGLSVGVAYGAGREAGTAVTIGIGLQNLPEGFAVAAAMTTAGTTRLRAFLVASATGAVEPIGGLVGVLAVSISDAVLPFALAGAAGAMLFVIAGEIVPETHRPGFEQSATFALVLGFVVMLVLDVAFV
jgi:ZIP family zinc transporter